MSADLDGTVGRRSTRVPAPRYALHGGGPRAAARPDRDHPRRALRGGGARAGPRRCCWRRPGSAATRAPASRREVTGDASARTLAFTVEPGAPADRHGRHVPGCASACRPPPSCRRPAERRRCSATPPRRASGWRSCTATRHYLAARVEAPRVIESEDRASVAIEVRVEEGPQALLGDVSLRGRDPGRDELADAAKLETGNAVRPGAGRGRDPAHPRVLPGARLRERARAAAAAAARDRPRPGAEDRRGRAAGGRRHRLHGPAADEGVDGAARGALQEGRAARPARAGAASSGACSTSTSSIARCVTASRGPRARKIDGHAPRAGPLHGPVRRAPQPRGGLLRPDRRRDREHRRHRASRWARASAAAPTSARRAARLHLPALGRSAEITASLFRVDEDFFLLNEEPCRSGHLHEGHRAPAGLRDPADARAPSPTGTCCTATASSASRA